MLIKCTMFIMGLDHQSPLPHLWLSDSGYFIFFPLWWRAEVGNPLIWACILSQWEADLRRSCNPGCLEDLTQVCPHWIPALTFLSVEGILSESLDRNSSCNSATKLDMLAVFSVRFSTQLLEKAFLRMALIRHFHQALDALLNMLSMIKTENFGRSLANICLSLCA